MISNKTALKKLCGHWRDARSADPLYYLGQDTLVRRVEDWIYWFQEVHAGYINPNDAVEMAKIYMRGKDLYEAKNAKR